MSAAQLLAWHCQRKCLPPFKRAAQAIDVAAVAAIEAREATRDVGGRLGTTNTGRPLVQRLLAA